MARYSIKDLENFTSIKAHTLRIWEQRYKLLKPSRTDTNIRYYSEYDLKKILNVNLLYNHGLKISKIAGLTDKEIFEHAEELLNESEKTADDNVDYFIRLLLDLEEESICLEFERLAKEKGIEKMYLNTMIPLLEKIGELWQVNTISVSHEHFFSNLLRDFLISEISTLTPAHVPAAKVVLFLHEDEQHELSLLFYHYFLKKRNFECYYLGRQVPMNDLQSFVVQMKPDFLVSSMIASISSKNMARIFSEIATFFPLDKVVVGGYQIDLAQDLLPSKVHKINGIEGLELKMFNKK